MFEILGAVAPRVPGIQEFEKSSGKNGSAAFDFDEILRREQGEQDLHADRETEAETTHRPPAEDRVAVERNDHTAAKVDDGKQVDAVAEVKEDAESGYVPLMALLEAAAMTEETNTEYEGEEPGQGIDPALVLRAPKGGEPQVESARFWFAASGTATWIS
jgi:hypothetical protein